MPDGAGDVLTVGLVTQFCQPPVPLTVTEAKGVAVRLSSRKLMVPRFVPDSAEAIRAATLLAPVPKLTPAYSSQLVLLIRSDSAKPWPARKSRSGPPPLRSASRAAAFCCRGGGAVEEALHRERGGPQRDGIGAEAAKLD